MFQGKWICDKEFLNLKPIELFHKQYSNLDIPESPIKNHHVYFLKKFDYKEGKYSINITADDYYKLYINRKFVGQGPAPGYRDVYNYNTYDITPFLRKGENTILVHTYYQGLINRVWNSADNRFGMIADIIKDGEYLFGTDKSWKYCPAEEYRSGGILAPGYNTAFLENIDMRKRKINFRNEIQEQYFVPAVVKTNDDHSFEKEPVKNLEVYRITPLQVLEKSPGHFFVDFGEELAGQIYFSAKGKRGEKVTVMCGEELTDGEKYSVRYHMRCNCNYIEECILSGKQDYFDFYDYKAFRYAEILAKPGSVNKNSIKMIVRNWQYDDRACEFRTPNKQLNKIWKICERAVKVAAQEVFVDCPTREKGQYLGDFLVTGLAHLYLTGDISLYSKALDDFVQSTRICKGMMAVAPCNYMQEIADFSLLFPEAVYNLYMYTADKDVIKKYMPVMEEIIEHFRKYEREDGLLEGVNDKWNLVDWPENLRDNYDFELCSVPSDVGCHNVMNAYYIGAVKKIRAMKNIVGEKDNYNIQKLEKAYLKEFYKPQQKVFTDTKQSFHASLHSNVLPLYFEIALDDTKEEIVKMIREKGLCCGVWFSYFVLRALGKAGKFQDELNLIMNENEHSWINMIREGASSCFEAWGKEQKWNTSLCHPWASSPIPVIAEDILGFRTDGKTAKFFAHKVNIPMELTVTYKSSKVSGKV